MSWRSVCMSPYRQRGLALAGAEGAGAHGPPAAVMPKLDHRLVVQHIVHHHPPVAWV